MKKFKVITSWSILVIYLVLILSFVLEKSEETRIGKIEVLITDSLQNRFLSTKEVLRLIQPDQSKILGTPDKDVNTAEIEKLIYAHPIVKQVNVYKTASGTLHIDISQRQPLIRIINAWNDDYYIDTEGRIMPWSGKFTAFVPVANGDIRYRLIRGKEYDVRDSSLGLLHDLYKMGLFLKQNRFWGSQIEQIYVNNQHDIELIPRVGAHLIIFGNMENAEGKFEKLDAIYRTGFGNVGWNGYETINLKFKNQVICSKRQP
jgi:cell division protein FtsQ